jgi:hypothetical protein
MDRTNPDDLLPDEDLWRLLDWEPPAAHGAPSDHPVSTSPSAAWIPWAKGVVFDASFVLEVDRSRVTARREAQALYLCRLMRILECIPRDKQGIENADLTSLFRSAAAVAGLEAAGRGVEPEFTVREARELGYISSQEIDTWHPGMRSGTGTRIFWKLTLLGKRKADALGPPPDLAGTADHIGEEQEPPPEAGPQDEADATTEAQSPSGKAPARPEPSADAAAEGARPEHKPEWSKPFSKSQAARILRISTDNLDDYLRDNPGAVRRMTRQKWLFDRKYPLFSHLR